MVGPLLNRLSFDLPPSKFAEVRLCRIVVLLLCGFPLGVPSQVTREVGLSACLNFPTAPMWVWKVACLHRSELTWTCRTPRANRASCSIVPRDHTKRILTSSGQKRKKCKSRCRFEIQRKSRSATVARCALQVSFFLHKYYTWCRPAHKSHTEGNCSMTTSVTENGKYEGKKRWVPRCISHEFVGVWTHTHTHTYIRKHHKHRECVAFGWRRVFVQEVKSGGRCLLYVHGKPKLKLQCCRSASVHARAPLCMHARVCKLQSV